LFNPYRSCILVDSLCGYYSVSDDKRMTRGVRSRKRNGLFLFGYNVDFSELQWYKVFRYGNIK